MNEPNEHGHYYGKIYPDPVMPAWSVKVAFQHWFPLHLLCRPITKPIYDPCHGYWIEFKGAAYATVIELQNGWWRITIESMDPFKIRIKGNGHHANG